MEKQKEEEKNQQQSKDFSNLEKQGIFVQDSFAKNGLNNIIINNLNRAREDSHGKFMTYIEYLEGDKIIEVTIESRNQSYKK